MPFLFGLLLFSGCSKEYEGDEPGECEDGADNNRDGLFDCDDQGCKGSPKCKEEVAKVENSKGSKIEGYEMVKIPKGTFIMGSSEGDVDEQPVHEVTITYDFYMMTTEVTQELYEKVMGNNPSHFKGAKKPVDSVSWFDAVRFANALSKKEGLEECYRISSGGAAWPKGFDCVGWRLPTEAEWEYAANGIQGFQYSGSDNIDEVAWYGEDWETGSSHAVGQKKANGFGLYDMSGNVFEWVWDWYGEYSSTLVSDPTGHSTGSLRVYRGGGWYFDAWIARVSDRGGYLPSYRGDYQGFRLFRTIR